ncbi:DUF308 domain-containing protein [Companilactobacillus alimentarius]|uniref:DUF308 domain-containing protein n=1 Tax=Companilactobacillus alimentarius DSM 20249 TaxID=1423720 RepID=A0A2K9HJ98_9LACO|nr:DUF308 domain-containing protein [Companilactobacillus alimentarius]AUI71836.1 hypothetical protein LA20249_06450 [Companilactobacillus alimentarius DSM 20249]MDT6952362.1 DUF308 domain-containing protein [Companilactobacillus alimentarius]GEO45169.1 membrane protein [Companilactobacillus alimentarius]
MVDPKKRFDWFGFIVGLVSLYAGYLVTWYPLKSLSTIAVIFGFFVIIRGVYQLWFGSQMTRVLGVRSGWTIFTAIIDIIIGIIFISHIQVGVVFIVYMFAIWFLLDAIFQIFTSRFYHFFGRKYYILIVILACLNLLFAIILLFNPVLAGGFIVFMLAFFFFATGIAEIIEAF